MAAVYFPQGHALPLLAEAICKSRRGVQCLAQVLWHRHVLAATVPPVPEGFHPLHAVAVSQETAPGWRWKLHSGSTGTGGACPVPRPPRGQSWYSGGHAGHAMLTACWFSESKALHYRWGAQRQPGGTTVPVHTTQPPSCLGDKTGGDSIASSPQRVPGTGRCLGAAPCARSAPAALT